MSTYSQLGLLYDVETSMYHNVMTKNPAWVDILTPSGLSPDLYHVSAKELPGKKYLLCASYYQINITPPRVPGFGDVNAVIVFDTYGFNSLGDLKSGDNGVLVARAYGVDQDLEDTRSFATKSTFNFSGAMITDTPTVRIYPFWTSHTRTVERGYT
jgi:hypothetical protein